MQGFANKIGARFFSARLQYRRRVQPMLLARATIARTIVTMNPLSNGQAGRSTVYPFNPLSRAASAQSGSPASADAKQRFIDEVTQAIKVDARLKEISPTCALTHEELLDLLREQDRLAPMCADGSAALERMCTDDAPALELAPHLSERVARLLKRALAAAGFTVVDHQASQNAQPGPVRIHTQPPEMKGPPPNDDDAVVGPEAGDPRIVHVDPFAGVAASVDPQKNLTAIEDLLDQQCKQARNEGKDSYRTATHARDAVMDAVFDGATTVMVDLPASLVTQLAQLGLTCRPKAQVLPVQQSVAESKDGPELAGALAAAGAQRQAGPQQPAAVIAVAPSGMDHGLTQQQIHDSWMGKDSRRRADLLDALKKGDSAAVMALMGSLKGAGLNPQQIGEILATRGSEGAPGLFLALYHGHASAVTAYMDGLKGAGLSQQQIGELLAAKGYGGFPGLYFALAFVKAPAVTAYMDGLKGAGLSPQQIPEIVAARTAWGAHFLYPRKRNSVSPAEAAYMNGLRDLQQHNLITAQQIAEIVSGSKIR